VDILLAWVGVALFVVGVAIVIRREMWDVADMRHPAWLALLVGAVCLGVAWLGLGVQPEDLFS
jgi:drug/metabolite transporter (DMT)-like permease